MNDTRFDRTFRTPYSEGYVLMRGRDRLGTLDIHFTTTTVHGTLVVTQDLTQEELSELIEQIDEDLVLSADTPRDDFIIISYRGTELGYFDDSLRPGQHGPNLDFPGEEDAE